LVRRGAEGDSTGTNISKVAEASVPLLLKMILGAAPSGDVLNLFVTYLEKAPIMIFGAAIHKHIGKWTGLSEKIVKLREGVATWGATTPWMEEFVKQAGTDSSITQSEDTLVRNMMDSTSFAGLLGTSTMISSCVQLQRRDPKQIAMFEENPERYIIELMRFDSAVTSVTEVLRQDTDVELLGWNLTLAKGSPQQLGIATANRDPHHWQHPDEFDPFRSDLGDTLAWNGRAQDVEARDFSKAPRHCPGYCLSIKAGAVMCAKMMGSFEKLLKESKIGGPVECNNFPRAARAAPVRKKINRTTGPQ